MKIPKWQYELARYYKRGKLISYFLNNAAKHVYMDCKFQRTLKLDISFSLEHFFISVAIFTQVASASLSDIYEILLTLSPSFESNNSSITELNRIQTFGKKRLIDKFYEGEYESARKQLFKR